ncbi:MAG: polysaccharide deacetylase [Lachnospiraceae bacterium]|nr:polysaccharide deacetylase [Lachnospiraceae bacterium]
MSQEQESVEQESTALEEDITEEYVVDSKNTGNIGNTVLLIVTFMVLCICTVLLVLVINLNKEVGNINAKLMTLQETGQYTAVDAQSNAVSDISGEDIDEDEAADIVAAAAIENQIVWGETESRSEGIKRVYLTFDDGPSPNTDRILDILKEYDVKATFFVVGKENYTDQYKRIVDEGHTLAMHSYSHVYKDIYSSLDAYKQDLGELRTFLYELTGVECNIVRFPGGSSNTISKVDMHTLIDYLDSENMVYYDWNVSSGDASGTYRSANQIASNVLGNIDKYNNAVVLMHDAAEKNSTVDALPTIIETILQSEDTVLLPISEDTVRVQHIR